MKGLNVLSLFDGISCGRLALERVGLPINTYYASEVNTYSIEVAKKNFPDIIEIGDVREVEPSNYTGIDLLMGGSPCQNFSMCGTTKGAVTKEGIEVTSLEQYLKLKEEEFEFDGYSYLFWEYVRILREVKPRYFLLENVKMSKKWEKVITNTLGVKPIEINSKLVSAQNRPRLYWTNIPGIEQPKDRGLYLGDVLKDTYSDKEVLSQKIQDRFLVLENSTYAYGTTKPKFRTIGQRDYVFADNYKIGCLVATDYKQPKQVWHNGVLRKISPEEAELLQTLPEGYTKGLSNTKRFECIGNGWTVDVIAHILMYMKF